YAHLAALWGVKPATVKDWISALRRTDPEKVYVTYRLVQGHRRTALIAQRTAEVLQDLHFPKDRMPTKLRGELSRNKRPPSYIRRRMAAEAAERAAMAPERRITVPSATSPTGSDAGRNQVVRKLTLPPMPRRDDLHPPGGFSPPVRRVVLPPMPRRD